MAGENATVELISRPGVGSYVVGGRLGHLSTVSIITPDELRVNAVANTSIAA